MRPHQSSLPDASQYTPMFHGIAGWQLYYGERYGAALSYPIDRWIHVKIVVAGSQAEVYVDDMDRPALFIDELKRQVKTGKVVFEVGEVPPFSAAHFSHFRYTPISHPTLKGKAAATEQTPFGTIRSWRISDTFEEGFLAGKVVLNDLDKSPFANWTSPPVESTGLANLARLNGVDGTKNTVFARVTIVSGEDQVKPLTFGFSDRIKIFLNDQLLYSGHDEFLSRDYRHLGTIGWYDTVYLDLKEGENELWVAVTEDFPFGGWGLQARIEDTAGIEIQ